MPQPIAPGSVKLFVLDTNVILAAFAAQEVRVLRGRIRGRLHTARSQQFGDLGLGQQFHQYVVQPLPAPVVQPVSPTQPLPPEYPSDHAFFTVTFYYNETPPAGQ